MHVDIFFLFAVSEQETKQAKQEWDGLTRYLDAVMSRFFKVENHEVGVFLLLIKYLR